MSLIEISQNGKIPSIINLSHYKKDLSDLPLGGTISMRIEGAKGEAKTEVRLGDTFAQLFEK